MHGSRLTHQRPDLWSEMTELFVEVTGKEITHEPNSQGTFSPLRTEYLSPDVAMVPEGCGEGLLHEIGHYIAATSIERALPNYGFGDIIYEPNEGEYRRGVGWDREYQAYAFECAVFKQQAMRFYNGRNGTSSPEHCGVLWREELHPWHFRWVERHLGVINIPLDKVQHIWGKWVEWEISTGSPAWTL